MNWWVSVAAVRIHGWIEQTPQLSHMRGASGALSRRTAPATIRALTTIPPEALQEAESSVDGVVVLTAPNETEAEGYARTLTGHLSRQVPGVQWEAWWCEAESYVAAFSRSNDPFDKVGRLRRLPALPEPGMVMTCLKCRNEPARRAGNTAVRVVVGDDDAAALATQGIGCEVRRDEGMVARRDLPDDDLRNQLRGRRVAATFDELARLGGVMPRSTTIALGRKESRNHLATVYADGNGIGAFFQAVACSPLTLPQLHRKAVGALNLATRTAVTQAAWEVAPDPEVTAIEPHFVGGDDVLASVPAPNAWAFAANLAGHFEELRRTLRQLLHDDLCDVKLTASEQTAVESLESRIDAISLGVGLCFAHASFPFAQTSHLAEAAMRQAKREGKGEDSRIGWVDLTAQHAHGGHPAVTVIDAYTARSELAVEPEDPQARPVFRLTPSARAQLTALLRDQPDAVTQWAKRLPSEELADLLARTPADRLRADLSRARWWPKANRDEQ